VVFDAPWQGIGLTYLVYGALPVAVSAVLQRAAIAWLPHNLASFIIGQGFSHRPSRSSRSPRLRPACSSRLADGVPVVIPAGYLLNTALLALGEAWFTGMATALIAVYRPAWVTTFDVRRYRLGGPRANAHAPCAGS
jgi:uncharacterized membrane protein